MTPHDRYLSVERLMANLDEVPAMGMSRWVSVPLLIITMILSSIAALLVAFGALILNALLQILKLAASPFVALWGWVDVVIVMWWFYTEMKEILERESID